MKEFICYLSFGNAIVYLKQGKKVARKGWNGKGMYLVMMDGYPEGVLANAETRQKHGLFMDSTVIIDPYIVMKTAQDTLQPGWLASQADMLSDDWCVLLNEDEDFPEEF